MSQSNAYKASFGLLVAKLASEDIIKDTLKVFLDTITFNVRQNIKIKKTFTTSLQYTFPKFNSFTNAARTKTLPINLPKIQCAQN